MMFILRFWEIVVIVVFLGREFFRMFGFYLNFNFSVL